MPIEKFLYYLSPSDLRKPDVRILNLFGGGKMHYKILATVALAVGLVTPALAAKKQSTTAIGWDDCYDLAWIRGVHTEQGELPGWMAQCQAGTIPFGEEFKKYYGRKPPK